MPELPRKARRKGPQKYPIFSNFARLNAGTQKARSPDFLCQCQKTILFLLPCKISDHFINQKFDFRTVLKRYFETEIFEWKIMKKLAILRSLMRAFSAGLPGQVGHFWKSALLTSHPALEFLKLVNSEGSQDPKCWVHSPGVLKGVFCPVPILFRTFHDLRDQF